MPPNDTKRSTHPKRTSRLYRIIGQVRNSMLIRSKSTAAPVDVAGLLRRVHDHDDDEDDDM